MIEVLLVDDDQLMRAGLRLIVQQAPDLTLVGEAADGREAVAAARRDRPRVVVMDVRMPGMDGIEATRQITAAPTRPGSSSSPPSSWTSTCSTPSRRAPQGSCSSAARPSS